MRIGSFIIYVVLGLAIHYMAYDTTSMTDAFTYIFMVFWPLFLIWWIVKWSFIVALVVALVVVACGALYRAVYGEWPWNVPTARLFERRNQP